MAAKDKGDLLQRNAGYAASQSTLSGADDGYGVGQSILQLAEDMLRVGEGSLYPALYRLEERGWITSEWGTSEK